MVRVVAYTLEQCWHRVPGGTAVSAMGAASALAARADVRLVGVAARHRHEPAPAWAPPIAVRQMPLPRRALYEAWHTARRPRIQRATGPVDLIHATGMAIPPRSAPLVVTVHDLAFLHHPEHATRNGRRFFRRSLELTAREADMVLCPSEATRRDCVDHGIDEDRTRVVPWGIDLPVARAADPVAAKERLAVLGVGDAPFVLWVGTIEPRKNLAALADAFRRLGRRDLQLVLVGPRGWNEDLTRHLAPLASRTHVLGFVPRDDLQLLYEQAAVFCYPSLLEGFGMPVLEAMASGAAVVTSRGTATEEVVGDAGLAVDPREPAEIADAMRSILDDPRRRALLASAARDRAATFTWQRTAEATAAAYASVAP